MDSSDIDAKYAEGVRIARMYLDYEETDIKKPKVLSILADKLADLLIHPETWSIIYDRFYDVLEKASNGCDVSSQTLGKLYQHCLKNNKEAPDYLKWYVANQVANPTKKYPPRNYGDVARYFHKDRIIRMVIHKIIRATGLYPTRNHDGSHQKSACDVIVEVHEDYFGKTVTYRRVEEIWSEKDSHNGDTFELWALMGFNFQEVVDDPRWRERFYTLEDSLAYMGPKASMPIFPKRVK